MAPNLPLLLITSPKHENMLSHLVDVRSVNRLDPSNLHSYPYQLGRYLPLSTLSKDNYKGYNLHLKSRHLWSFGFSSRLVGNLLHMCDPLSNEYTTWEVGILTLVLSQTLISFSKVSRIYLLVNLISICRYVCTVQQGLTAKICPI